MASAQYAVDALNQTIDSFKAKLDIKMESVNQSTANMRNTTEKIHDSVGRFKEDMVQNEEKQLAHENILRIDQILKEQFGDHEAIRRTVMGVVRDFDINLVRNSSIQEISEELWITSSRYWLSYALIAITAWINDCREVAVNALSECARRDPVKASLFFCLFHLRFGRYPVARKWFCEYLKTLDPSEMQPESAILLQAYLNGLFGTYKELEHRVNEVIGGWVSRLNANQELARELTGAYQKYIQHLPPAKECHYPALERFCGSYGEIRQACGDVSKYERLIALVEQMDVELEEQTDNSYKGRVDAILTALISNYDEEELELKNQQTYFHFVIDHEGRVDAANQQFQEYQNVRKESFNIGKQMVKWAIYDDLSQTDIHVKKFGLQNTRIWFRAAVESWAQKLREAQPLDFPLTIDSWKTVSNGEDQVEQVESLKQHYRSNRFRLLYVNPYNTAALIVLVLSVGLAFITPFSLAAAAACVGFLAFRVVRADRDYKAKVNGAVESLNACMAELADFRRFYSGSSAGKEVLLSKLEYL